MSDHDDKFSYYDKHGCWPEDAKDKPEVKKTWKEKIKEGLIGIVVLIFILSLIPLSLTALTVLVGFGAAATVKIHHEVTRIRFECVKLESGIAAPVSRDAKKLAKALRTKNCNNWRFREYAKNKDIEISIDDATEQQQFDYETGNL